MDTVADPDAALIAACFEQIEARGWTRLSIAAAAHDAGIPIATARRLVPDRLALLRRFGALADDFALRDAPPEGPPRDRLFDLVMRRIDFLQAHRAGVIALLRAAPFDPPAALLLAASSLRSMTWLLESAGIAAAGPQGALRAVGLLAVWGWTVRAWERDTSEDMAATMAALDTALGRAEQAAGWLASRARAEPPDPTPTPPPAQPADAPVIPPE